MDSTIEGHSAASGGRGPGSPEGKVIAAVAPSAVDAAMTALEAAGFAADQIDLVTPADLEHLESPLDRPGFGGLVGRFVLSLGDDLDEIEAMREELAAGDVLIGVQVEGHEAVLQVRDILLEHGGHGIIHFGRWTITTFE